MNFSPSFAIVSPERTAPGERARIVAVAHALYVSQGIAAVSVADIAGCLRLSPGRVLHHFPHKAALIGAVVDAQVQAIYQQLCLHRAHSSNAVEELLALRNWASAEMKPGLVPFFQQLAADFPAEQQRWQSHVAGFSTKHLCHNLRWGIQQCLYRPDLDVDAQARRWCEKTRIFRTAAAIDRADMHRALLNNFIAAIVTPAGALAVRRLQEAHPFY
ncbi:TetR/AcrR family transcriptional regulator [Hymenobacter properus]|uniref:TetR/AcrR family transcriptional regulator n=1 Tax=Hymenobacter properus TaxID=2791026 RepID=A0A931FID6_9BACT|nr:helix-turn-helix domain-containing protein [Hymenobacter properus]MBF9141942.1 TetR/AcrR family transcriptional regulator [Hymenobacter properus]MBR7720749.1 TetR/AcrR family transcriptional regulator [Microvirga sp. SRT04]